MSDDIDTGAASGTDDASGTGGTSGTDDAAGTDDSISYAAALRELEEILAGLERDNVDVDHLAERVQRASVLIRLCRERISTAQMRIERVVTDLDGGG
ncbi:MAG: exodeoxyribonuclease VII small subunit [Acidimicrobiia bacterium]